MNAFRWIICFPLGVAVALAFSGIILRLGDALVGSWRPASGLVVYTAAGNLPVIAMTLGLGVAPRVSRRLKWLLLSPHIAYGTLVALPTLAALVFSSEQIGIPGDLNLSRSLTLPWQLGLWNFGYLAGVLFAGSRDIEELATAGPGRPESSGRLMKVPEVFWKETRYARMAAKAFRLRERGRVPEAIQALHRARKIIEQLWAKDPATYAHPLGQIHRRLADARAEIGERGAAREHFEASVSLLRQADDAKPGLCTVELAETLVNMGVLYSQTAAYELAKASFEDARALFLAIDGKQAGERTGDVALTEAHLGNLLCESGDAERGKEELERALERFRALDLERPGTFTEDITHALSSLGAVYGELGLYEQSESFLKESLGTLEALAAETAGPARARASLNLANVQVKAGRLHEARATYQESLRQLEALDRARPGAFTVDLAQARANQANLLSSLGLFHQARDVLEENLTLFQELDRQESGAYSKELALTHMNLAGAHSETGEFGKARACLDEALARLRLLREAQPGAFTAELAHALTNAAPIATDAGRFETAENVLKEAMTLLLPLYEKQPDLHVLGLATIHSKLGYLHVRTRRLNEAKDGYETARRLLEQHEAEHRDRFFHHLAVLYCNLGTVYSELGELSRGTKLYEESLARLRRFESEEPGGYTADIALTLANLGANDSDLRSYAKAAERLEEAHELFAELERSQPGVYLPYLARIYARVAANVLDQTGRRADQEASTAAVAACQRAVSLFEQLEAGQPGSYTHDLAISRANLGGLHVDRGELDLGERELELADAIFKKLEDEAPGAHDSEWSKAHENLGRIERARKRLEEAHAHWRIALELSERRRGILSSQEGRGHYQGRFVSLYRQMVRLCMDLGRPLEAWHFAERGKARGLLDLFANVAPKLSSSRDRELFEEWKAAEQEAIPFLDTEDPGERLLPSRERRKFPRLHAAYPNEARAAEAFTREEDLRLRLLDRIGRAAVQVDVPPPELLARTLQEMVGGRRVLLLQWVPLFSDDADEEERPEPIALFVLPLDADLGDRAALEAAFRHTIVELEPGATLRLLAAYYEILRYRSEAAFEALSDLMGEVFMLPVVSAVEELMGAPLAQLGLDALLLVPGRGFQVMPLHAARLDHRRDRYLVDEAPVFYLGSCHLAGQLTARKASSEADSVALMGPPPVNDPFADLPEAWKEVSKLREVFESRGFPIHVHQGSAMTVNALKRHRRRLALLHLATHSLFSTENALKSHVQFCGENLSLDRLLQEPELDFSGMKLVYLSSCDAGWMEGIWDEEPQGLVYGFLRAGAGAVMASLLPVLDHSARILAELFYEEVAKGRPLAEAHREALRLLRRIDGGHFGNPMHWASMMLHGAGLDRIVPAR